MLGRSACRRVYLDAGYGGTASRELSREGPDAAEALDELEALVADRFGNPGTAYRFDGNDWIDIGTIVSRYDMITMSAWVKLASDPLQGGGVIVSKPGQRGVRGYEWGSYMSGGIVSIGNPSNPSGTRYIFILCIYRFCLNFAYFCIWEKFFNSFNPLP